MAQLTWQNVNADGLNGAVANAQNASNTMYSRVGDLVKAGQGLLGDMQQGIKNQWEFEREENTQEIINRMNQVDSLDELQQIRDSLSAGALRGQYGNKIDLSKINQAQATLAVDANNRAEGKDSLQDFTPEQKEIASKIQQSLLLGDITTATELLNSSNFSNKTKTNILNSIYKARQDNIDFNLKIAEHQGKLANTNEAIKAKESEIQTYLNDFGRLNGNISEETKQKMLSQDPTYQKLNQELLALGQSYNLLLSQQKVFGSSTIGNMYSIPENNINTLPTEPANSTPAKQEEALVAQQAIQQEDTSNNNNNLDTTDLEGKIAQSEVKKSYNDVTREIKEFDKGLKISELLPPNAQKAFDAYVNGTFDYTKYNADVLEQNLNNIIREYNAKNGTNIPEVTIPKTNAALEDYKKRYKKSIAELDKTKSEKLDELFGVNGNIGKNSERNLLKTLLNPEWRDNEKYNKLSPNDVVQKLENGYYQGPYDGDDLIDKAKALMSLGLEAGEVMQLIDVMTNNGTKELEGIGFNSNPNQWTQLTNLVTVLTDNPELLSHLRDQQDKVITEFDTAKTGLTNSLALGGSLTAVNSGGSGDKAIQSREGTARKFEVEQKLNKRIKELSVLTDIAKDNKDTTNSINELSAEEVKELVKDRTFNTYDLVKLYILSGNPVPTKLDEKTIDKIHKEVSKLSGQEIKELLQTNVNIEKLQSEILEVRKLMDEEKVNNDLVKKVNALEAKLKR